MRRYAFNLAERQFEFLRLSATEKTATEIADAMGIDVGSISTLRDKVYKRIGVHSREDAATLLRQWLAENPSGYAQTDPEVLSAIVAVIGKRPLRLDYIKRRVENNLGRCLPSPAIANALCELVDRGSLLHNRKRSPDGKWLDYFEHKALVVNGDRPLPDWCNE